MGRRTGRLGGGPSLRDVRIAQTSMPGTVMRSSAANRMLMMREMVIGVVSSKDARIDGEIPGTAPCNR
jgi:hypothetical protein